MSCMHRLQSYSTQEALSSNSWYKISIQTVARPLFGSLRQNVHPIHKQISKLRRLRMRTVRCKILRIHCSQESIHRRISSISDNDGHQATIHPHDSNRSRRRIHKPPDADSPQRASNEPRRLCQRWALFSGSSWNCRQQSTTQCTSHDATRKCT